jgi:hypothetical protein
MLIAPRGSPAFLPVSPRRREIDPDTTACRYQQTTVESCLLCETSLHTREMQPPVMSSFKAAGAYGHRYGLLSGYFAQDFYNQFSDLLERLATFSA